MVGADTQHGDIYVGVATDKPGVEGAPVGQRDLYMPGALNDMRVREHLAVGGEDETGAQPRTETGAAIVVGAKVAPATLHIDTHYSRSDPFRRRGHRTRIGIQCLSISLICIHHQVSRFPMEPGTYSMYE